MKLGLILSLGQIPSKFDACFGISILLSKLNTLSFCTLFWLKYYKVY